MSDFNPKKGDMILVNYGIKHKEREFISMTSNKRYLCWDENKTEANVWKNVEPLKPKTEKRWLMMKDNVRHTEGINFCNQGLIDEFYKPEDGWYKGEMIEVEQQ